MFQLYLHNIFCEVSQVNFTHWWCSYIRHGVYIYILIHIKRIILHITEIVFVMRNIRGMCLSIYKYQKEEIIISIYTKKECILFVFKYFFQFQSIICYTFIVLHIKLYKVMTITSCVMNTNINDYDIFSRRFYTVS